MLPIIIRGQVEYVCLFSASEKLSGKKFMCKMQQKKKLILSLTLNIRAVFVGLLIINTVL